jgi:transcriptional regulator with XRE-family HTH domain
MGKPATRLGRAMAAAIRDAASAQGLDYFDVAELFGVQPHYVRRLFRGDISASIGQLEIYALALGLTFRCTLVRENTKAPRGPRSDEEAAAMD